jgi:hypothetical protein
MKWPKWKIADGRGDFLPLMIGCVMMFLSLPSFLLVLFNSDRNSEALGTPLLVIFGTGIVLGIGFLVLGVQLMAMPGSLAYRIAHGRIFFWR